MVDAQPRRSRLGIGMLLRAEEGVDPNPFSPDIVTSYGSWTHRENRRMRRHKRNDDGGLTSVAIDDILERGSLDDWIVLRDAAVRDRAIADRIVGVCLAHEMYGTSVLWVEIINRLNEKAR